MIKNKKGMSMTSMVGGLVILVLLLMVSQPLIAKSFRSGNNVIVDQACKLQDYDGDGTVNALELAGIDMARPCPCDNNKDAFGYGYKLRVSTFNQSQFSMININSKGPYELFKESSQDYFIHRRWLSEGDLDELRVKLRSLRLGNSSFKANIPISFSDELAQYIKKDVDLAHPPSQFFCPRACAGKKSTDYSCCDIETFQKEWFAKGTDENNHLIGECKTPLKICNVKMVEQCKKDSKKDKKK